MASLRKFPKSKYWFACFTLADGRRVQRSTKEVKRAAAHKKAEEWEVLAKQRVKAKQAQRVIAEIYRAAHGKDLPAGTPRTYFEAWLQRRRGEIAPASYAAYKGRLLHFLEWQGGAADRPLAEVETTHISAYRDELAKRRSPTTANHAVKILRAVFEDARKDGHIAENPAKDCPTLRKTNGPGRRAFTLDELRRVLEAADGEWRSMILFGVYTGQRLGDIARLSWSNVDLVAQEIHLVTAKTRRVVRIPIPAPLLTHIESLPAGDDPKAFIHPEAARSKERNGSTLSRRFGELLASVGLAAVRDHEKTGEGRAATRAVSELSFHSLRHTATSLLKNAGISPEIVRDIIGHNSAEVSRLYTHVSAAAKRAAVDQLPDLTQHKP